MKGGDEQVMDDRINFDSLVMWLVSQEELPPRGPRGSPRNTIRVQLHQGFIEGISRRLIDDEEYRCESVKRYLAC